MQYFGTDLRRPGHYIWDLDGDQLRDSKTGYHDVPFSLENFIDTKNGFRPGMMKFDNVEGYSVLAITGSCSDKRHGTKTIFFTNEKVDFDAMQEKIKAIPIAMKILNQLREKIKEHWQDGSNFTRAIDRFFPDETPFII